MLRFGPNTAVISGLSRAASFIVLALAVILTSARVGQAAGEAPVTLLTIDGAIGPATADYVVRGMSRAANTGSQLVILQMDTPGGLDTSMRTIIKSILASPVPVASFVAPGGARAASAGTYIMYASHIAAMAPGTNLGAATPVRLGGAPEEQDRSAPGSRPDSKPSAGSPEKKPAGENRNSAGDSGKTDRNAGKTDGGDTGKTDSRDIGKKSGREPADATTSPSSRKQVNDAAAYIRSLADLRGRNAEWAERAVTESVSLPATEALKLNVIDLIAADVPALLARLDGRQVNTLGQNKRLQTTNAAVIDARPDWRARLLATITNPGIALLLMTIGVYGLLFEFMNPGFAVPGVVGAICLLLALYALQLLPVNYAGLALILLGLGFMAAEAFLPSFGALGLGGIAAFAAGSLILIDTDLPGYGVPLAMIGMIATASALLIAATVGMAVKARRRAPAAGASDLNGSLAKVVEAARGETWIRLRGETWRATSAEPLRPGQTVRVTARDGLVLHVAPVQLDEKGE